MVNADRHGQALSELNKSIRRNGIIGEEGKRMGAEDEKRMGAFVEHDFERGFILDEERMRKIHNLIESRISKYPTPLSLRYRVSRGDSLSYETASVQDVVNEDNDDWRAITRLELFAKQEDVLTFRLTFAKERVFVYIIGNDRDAVFLLFSDLREYIRNEVLAGRKFDRQTARLVSFGIIPLAMFSLLFAIARSWKVDPQLTSKVLATNDLVEKLNFLIQDRIREPASFHALPWLLAVMVVGFAGGDVLVLLWNSAFPTNLFLFGKRKATFDKRRRLLGNIFWVVIVGLIVSAVAGLIVWRLTSK